MGGGIVLPDKIFRLRALAPRVLLHQRRLQLPSRSTDFHSLRLEESRVSSASQTIGSRYQEEETDVQRDHNFVRSS